MGYFLMPQAEPEFDVKLVAAEATRVFIKTHGVPAVGVDIQMDLERRVLRVIDRTTKASEVFTFLELGFF